MNSDQVFAAIEKIAATPGKMDKTNLVRDLLGDELGERVLKAAYDPFVTYGVKKMPMHERECEPRQFDESTWLLLDRLAKRELTGNEAKAALQVELGSLTADSVELLTRILTKDLRAGFTEGTINRAVPGTIVTFECALAHPYKVHKHKLTFPLYAEPKLDGVRVLAFVNLTEPNLWWNGSVRFFSRSGKEYTTFDHLKEPLLSRAYDFWRNTVHDRNSETAGTENDDCAELLQVVFDGEVVSGSFNKTVGDVRRKDEQAVDAKFCVFDFLTQEEWGVLDSKDGCWMAGPYEQRRKRLEQAISGPAAGVTVFRLPTWPCADEESIYKLYDSVRAKGVEGLIVKDPKAFYYRKRHHAFAKIKAEETEDLKVVDAFEGEGKYVGMLGGVIVDREGVAVKVGGGFSDEQRAEFWAAYQRDMKGGVPEGGVGELVGRLIEVKFHEVTPDGSLRHPVFVRFRDTLSPGVKE
jgi:DNA ligase-1